MDRPREAVRRWRRVRARWGSLKRAPGGVGLTASQRTNPLTMVATAEEYPEALLTQDDFNSVRASFRELAKKTPPEQMPRFETSCGRGGVFVFVATDQRSKELLLNKLATLEFGARNSGWQG